MRFFTTLSRMGIAASAMLVPIIASAIGIQVMIDGRAVTFYDVPQTAWYASSIQAAAEAGIVNGYKNSLGNLTGRFGPENNVTVAEALKIAVESAGYDAQIYGSLVQSGTSHWASRYVSVAKSEGFVLGDRLTLRMDMPANRNEVAAMITAAFRVDTTSMTPVDTRFTDVNTSTPFATSIAILTQDKVASGDTDSNNQPVGTFRPLDHINRAEVVKLAMAARAKYGEPGKGRQPAQSSKTTVHYTTNGFSPSVLNVAQGTTVTFINDTTDALRVASNPHPTHTDYPGFDSVRSLGQGEIYTFTFNKIGTWGFHNHFNSGVGGTVIVK